MNLLALAASTLALAAPAKPYVVHLLPGCVWDNGKPVEVITRRRNTGINIENRDTRAHRFSTLPTIPLLPGDLVAAAYRRDGVYRVTTCGGRARLIVSIHPAWKKP